MDFQAAVDAVRALDGQQVIVVLDVGEWTRQDRPYRGELNYLADRSDFDVAMFRLHEPHDPRWTNPGGVQLIITRAEFGGAERCGGPGELGLSIVQGKIRLSIYPTGPPP